MRVFFNFKENECLVLSYHERVVFAGDFLALDHVAVLVEYFAQLGGLHRLLDVADEYFGAHER